MWKLIDSINAFLNRLDPRTRALVESVAWAFASGFADSAAQMFFTGKWDGKRSLMTAAFGGYVAVQNLFRKPPQPKN